MQLRLSILIPAIPSRIDQAVRLYRKVLEMTAGMDIEVLMLTDNKKRSIGAKRESLKNICQGKYFMRLDDDDDLLKIDKVYAACLKEVDVITFKQRCLNKDKSTYIVTFGLGNAIEHNTNDDGNYLDLRRPPWDVCAWNQKFKQYAYPDISYGEDAAWLEQVWPLARTEEFIDEIVCTYNWDPIITEASTVSNSHWENPNRTAPVRRCIVSLATGPERYHLGLRRLEDSTREFCTTDQIATDFYAGVEPVGAPSHDLNPYAFKVYAIQQARDAGFNQVLWLDACHVQVKSALPVFDWLTEKGIFLEEAGHLVGSWCNEYTLRYFGISREEAMKMPMFAAGYCGFDFRRPESIEFFAEWKESMLNGCFKGSWIDHRHDMTCGSIIANKRGLVPKYSPGGQFFAYVGPAYVQHLPTACFHLYGL